MRRRDLEHPEDARARKRSILGLVLAIAGITAIVGVVLVSLAVATQNWWVGAPMPDSVQDAIRSEYEFGLLMIGGGLSVVVCTWAWASELRPTRR